MNFYGLVGTRSKQSVLALTLDNDTQEALSSMFDHLADGILTGEQISFDPNYRAADDEIIVISPYAPPPSLSSLFNVASASVLPLLKADDINTAGIRAIAAVDWNGTQPHFVAFQRVESRYLLTQERWRLMFAHGRLVRDDRPGLEIAERIDAVIQNEKLYIVSWPKAHAILDLSMWSREATVAEMDAFFKHKKIALAQGFDSKTLADSAVRRKIASITVSNVLERCSVQSLRQYALGFGVSVQISKGTLILPSDKKDFKSVLGLLDEDLLAFEPTKERWVVNSKRRAG
jgi:hypothetical protein